MALLLALALTGPLACARDPAQVAWDDAFMQALRAPPEERAPLLSALAERAPRAVDRGAAAFEAALALEDAAERRGEPPIEAARAWAELAATAPRRADRARAHYQLSRIAEARGRIAEAEAIDRALVQHYPDLMPGERALAHLVRRARAGPDPDRAMDDLLGWIRESPALVDSALGDNALYLAGEEAERRYRRDGDLALATLAVSLYDTMAERYPGSALWNDALWNRSHLDHGLGRFEDEIAAIRRIQRSRAPVSLFGQNEHEYYWKGQLRIARVLLLDLRRPREAAEAYLAYRTMYPLSIRHDDVLFFAGCALIAAGEASDRQEAERLWAELAASYPESRYRRRLPTPSPAQCVPPEVE